MAHKIACGFGLKLTLGLWAYESSIWSCKLLKQIFLKKIVCKLIVFSYNPLFIHRVLPVDSWCFWYFVNSYVVVTLVVFINSSDDSFADLYGFSKLTADWSADWFDGFFSVD